MQFTGMCQVLYLGVMGFQVWSSDKAIVAETGHGEGEMIVMHECDQ
jgi:hypothetical protein